MVPALARTLSGGFSNGLDRGPDGNPGHRERFQDRGGHRARSEADVIRFTLDEPDFDSAPHINQAGIDNILKGNSHYVDPAGISSFRQAVAAYVGRTRSLTADPDQVVALPGAKPGIPYTIITYVNPGR